MSETCFVISSLKLRRVLRETPRNTPERGIEGVSGREMEREGEKWREREVNRRRRRG
jgi:hypothetical protein